MSSRVADAERALLAADKLAAAIIERDTAEPGYAQAVARLLAVALALKREAKIGDDGTAPPFDPQVLLP